MVVNVYLKVHAGFAPVLFHYRKVGLGTGGVFPSCRLRYAVPCSEWIPAIREAFSLPRVPLL